MEAYVHNTINKGIATIEFFHPTHNSLPGKILTKLANTIKEAGQDNTIKVIILKSGGHRTFCAHATKKEAIEVPSSRK